MPATRPRAAPRRWLSVREAADYCGFAVRTLRQRIADGDLPAYQPRGSRLLRIDVRDVDAMIIAEGRVPSAHLGDGRPASRPRAGKGGGDAA